MILEQTSHSNHNKRLALIFAGWGMDARPFTAISRQGYDSAVAHSYHTHTSQLPEWINHYEEICVIAWSYGVCMAEKWIQAHPQLPVTLKIAVNGTPTPVDDLTGIPRPIYEGTLRGLCERSVYKFYRRMCTTAEEFAKFKANIPQRSITSLIDELAIFGEIRPTHPTAWDIAYVSDSDAIIPYDNQLRAWHNISDLRIQHSGHLPDFKTILKECLIDKTDVEQKFTTHAHTYNSNATQQRQMCLHLAEKIKEVPCLKTCKILEIGAGTGILTKLYAPYTDCAKLDLWDLTPVPDSLPGTHRQCDAETAIKQLAPSTYNLIISSSTIQWMNSPRRFVADCVKTVAPGGKLFISTFGPDTFKELRPRLPISLRYPSTEEWQTLSLEDAEIDVEEESTIMQFDTSGALMRHISQTGATGCGTPDKEAVKACRAILSSGITSLTYHSIYITITKHNNG